MEYKILEAYRDKGGDKIKILEGIFGSVLLGLGVLFKETPLTIAGTTIIGIPIIHQVFEYGKAYMEARLDYLKNNKFTKLEEKVEKP